MQRITKVTFAPFDAVVIRSILATEVPSLMAGGAIPRTGNGGKDYPGKMTLFVFLACLLFSDDLSLSSFFGCGCEGGVTSMDGFLVKFFPSVYRKEKEDASTNQYCRFDSQLLTAFTSSLYLAALIASFFASSVTRAFGRKWSMFGGGITFLVGAAINGAAESVLMLIVGRILLGVGVGFASQVRTGLLSLTDTCDLI
ncbi:hypothetical protein B296_00055346 [Ensete ventricosum]|uniref:Major facilitator superfamily (MFS) profile domain-containing protein n=1 Tax=Ensete ventricosum TaxID=4639 RepID=A0A426X2G4_ENSVE|nr:hypothetical protein B296_00055346 [Ensete ventricosum]